MEEQASGEEDSDVAQEHDGVHPYRQPVVLTCLLHNNSTAQAPRDATEDGGKKADSSLSGGKSGNDLHVKREVKHHCHIGSKGEEICSGASEYGRFSDNVFWGEGFNCEAGFGKDEENEEEEGEGEGDEGGWVRVREVADAVEAD